MMIRKGRVSFGALVAAAVTGVYAYGDGIAVPGDATLILGVTNATVSVRPAVEGTLRKEGSQTLTLEDADSPNGTLEVREGTLKLTVTNGPSAANLPVWVPQTAALWFDANTNAVTGAGTNGVVQWLDAREADQAEPYLYARAVQHNDEPVPLLGTGEETIHGQRYLDFGGFGSGRWLKWVNPDASRLAVSNILHVFIVFGQQPGFGFLLGDWDWNLEGNVGRKDFHIGDIGPGGTNCFLWDNNVANTAAQVLYGRTCLNGVLIDGARTKPHAGYQVFDVATASGAYASNFCNDHNWKAGQPAVGVDRQGGPRYCEALIFTNQLTVAQRSEVADYLTEKWLARERRAGPVETVAGTRTETEAGAGQTLTVAALSGDGGMVKTGAGTLRFKHDTALFRGAVRLENGVIESALQREDLPFVAEAGGQALSAEPGTVSRAAENDSGLFRKTGGGALTLVGVSNAVARVDVAAGLLRLSAPFSPVTAVARATIPNAGFEDHAVIAGSTWLTGLNPAGWTLITVGSNGKGGVTLDTANNPWVGAGAIPEGDSAVFFQYDGGIKTTVQVPREGRYRLSFWAAARYDNVNNRQHDFGVWLGTQQVAVAKTYFASFERHEYATPPLTNGAYELRFQGIVGTINRSSIIDDVRLELLDTGTFAQLPNGGFEYSDHFGTANGTATYQMGPSNAVWTFEGSNTCGLAEAIPWAAPGQLFARVVPEGRRCAFIKREGALRQTLRFPATGEVYRLSFKAAAREAREGHAFKVIWDGLPVIPYFQLGYARFQTYEVTLPPVTNWTAELAFVGVVTNEASEATALFDDVRVFRADDVVVSNGSFEVTTSLAEGDYTGYAVACAGAEWVFEKGADNLNCGISGMGFGYPYLGGRMGFLQGLGRIRQTVTLPEPGTYVLSFSAAGRQGKIGHQFEVCWGGTRLGVVSTEDSVFRKYALRLPHAAAATSAEILFRGLISGSSYFSLLDDVKIERVSTGGAEGLLPETVRVSVAPGAKLDLDFIGTLRVKDVTLGGLGKSQIISAATCPAYITGTGALYTPAKGTLIRVQ